MSKKTESLKEIDIEIKLTPDHRKKIAQLLEDSPDRFLDARDFVSRALDVFLTWEKDPFNSMTKMAEMEPTMKQFQCMSMMMNPQQLKEMHPDFPEVWGSKWKEFLEKNPIQISESSTSQKQHDARKSEKDFERIQENMLDANNFLREIKFDDVIDEKLEQIQYDQWPLISTFYSRFFPAKIGVITLAEMMRKQKSPIVDFEEFKIKAYDIAEEIARKMIPFEKEKGKKRSQKKSTGLPKPYDLEETTGLQSIKEQRYKDRYFGKVTKSKESNEINLDGLLSALGLVKVFSKNKDTTITLTEKGKKFCLFDNPVFKGKVDESLSKDESEFIVTNCIPQRPVQHQIVKRVIKIVSETDFNKTPDMVDDLDEVCRMAIQDMADSDKLGEYAVKIQRDVLDKSKEILKSNKVIDDKILEINDDEKEVRNLKKMKKQTPVESIRIATMGRLSELGVVHWHINEGGRSEYTIEDKKLAESVSK
ncbi:MAG: hypothetical protein HOD60_07755 [Candidatus Nitrosopelagicus sp.]|nr:hypothetical protein [Candidatus Nitrosopelagicus sp.]